MGEPVFMMKHAVEASVVNDGLVENKRLTWKNTCGELLHISKPVSKICGMLNQGIMLLHDNTRLHYVGVTENVN